MQVEDLVANNETVILHRGQEGVEVFPLPGVADLDEKRFSEIVEILNIVQDASRQRLAAGELERLRRYPSAEPRELAAAIARSAGHRRQLLADAHTVEDAARLLEVSTSRIRQRVKIDQSLYAVKLGGEWRIPDWQFAEGAEIPGIASVNRCLPRDVDLLEIEGFFSNPNVDLQVDGQQLSPLNWLRAGLDAEPVVRLARTL